MMSSRNSIIGWVVSRWWLKLISLALAVSLWLFVQGKETLEVSSSLQITLEPANNLAIAGPSVLEKDVTIRGPRALLESYKNTPLSATILPTVTGKRRLRLDKNSLVERGYLDEKWDVRLDLIVHEPYVDFTVEENSSKTVPIRAVLQGSPREEYLIEKIVVQPQNITLTGASSLLSPLQHISTEPLSVEDIFEDTTQEVFLDIPTAIKTKFSEESVHLALTVGREKINQLFSQISVEVQHPKLSAVSIVPNTISVVLQSHPSTLRDLNTEELEAFVNANDLGPGKHDLDVQLHIPQGTSLIETIPPRIRVTLGRKTRPKTLKK